LNLLIFAFSVLGFGLFEFLFVCVSAPEASKELTLADEVLFALSAFDACDKCIKLF
jgi:hypothetical protein